MRIINGYKVYELSELVYKDRLWCTPDTGENVAMGVHNKYYGGYRTVKDTYSDKEFIKKRDERVTKKPFFYADEACGWIIYVLVMIFGNIFVGFFPWGMIFTTIYFIIWRKGYRDRFEPPH